MGRKFSQALSTLTMFAAAVAMESLSPCVSLSCIRNIITATASETSLTAVSSWTPHMDIDSQVLTSDKSVLQYIRHLRGFGGTLFIPSYRRCST